MFPWCCVDVTFRETINCCLSARHEGQGALKLALGRWIVTSFVGRHQFCVVVAPSGGDAVHVSVNRTLGSDEGRGGSCFSTQTQMTVCLLQGSKVVTLQPKRNFCCAVSLFQAFLAPFHKTVSLILLLSSGWCRDHRVLVRSVDCSWRAWGEKNLDPLLLLSFFFNIFLVFSFFFLCFFFYNKCTQTRKSKTNKKKNK